MNPILAKAIPAAIAATLGFAGAAQAQQTLNIVSWGGAYEMSQQKAYHDPWTEQTGDTIVNIPDAQNGLAGLRAQAEAGEFTWDLVDMLPSDAKIACAEGLIEPLDHDDILAEAPDGTDPTDDFIEGAIDECFVASIVYSNVIAINTEVFVEGRLPQTMADIFDVQRFPGKRSLQNKPINNLEWALMADGVPAEDVYEVLSTDEGVARAFAKLDTIKDYVIWWQEGAQPPQLLADGEVAFASGYNGRFFDAQVNEGQPFQIIWDAQVFELDGWVVPMGKLDKVQDYLEFATDTQRLADQAKFISYGPARVSSAALVSTHVPTGIEMKPHMPTFGPNFATALPKDDEFWADNLDELSERFAAWLAQG